MFELIILLLVSAESGVLAENAACDQVDLRSLFGRLSTFDIETNDKIRNLREFVTATYSTVSTDLDDTNRRLDRLYATVDSIKKTIENINRVLEIDECESRPCLNGATCVDGIYSYSCRCITGYNGTNCQKEIDECINRYSCTCVAGYNGTNCQIAPVLPNYYGTSFITGFTKSVVNDVPSLLVACVEETALISVSIPALGIVNEQHQLNRGALTLTYSSGLVSNSSGTISDKSIYVTSSKKVMLFAGFLSNGGSADGSLVMPESSTGTKYIISGHPSTNGGTDEFLIIGLVNFTSISINTKSFKENITLNRMKTYMRAQADLSGTMISASSPVYVLSGHYCANIPNISVGYCDYLEEAMPPISSLGKHHIVSYMKPRPDFTVSFAAPYNSTSVTIYNADGIVLETISSMKQMDVVFRTYAGFQTLSVLSSQPILVTQYGHGRGIESTGGDPSMMTIPDVNHFGNQYNFIVPNDFNSGITIVMNSSYSTADLLLDNVAFVPTESITASITGYKDYVILYGNIAPGYHKLAHATGTFGAWIYGRLPAAEYAWSLGHT